MLLPTRKAAHVSAADERMLVDLQRATFNYFVVNQDFTTGLPLDRNVAYSPATVAGAGFSITAYCVAAYNGWITRDDAAEYCHKVMRTLWTAPEGDELEGAGSYRGFFYHFLDPKLATRACDVKFWPQNMRWFKVRPPRIDVELSVIDTALLMCGVLFARNFFAGKAPRERSIRELATKLYHRVEWDWLLTDDNLLRMGWKPETGLLDAKFFGLTEAQLLYLIAIGSPTHPISPAAWQAQLQEVKCETVYGEHLVRMLDMPMFGYQYPLCWIPFKGIRDRFNRDLGFDWFTNACRAVRAQQRYAIENPLGMRDYGPRVWGLSACNGPGDAVISIAGRDRVFHSYGVRGPGGPDDGTIAPGAVAASLPLAPGLVLATLRDWTRYRPELFTATGPTDAFNPTFSPDQPSGWVDSEQLAIDQGPIVLMIENFRSGLIWRVMKHDPDLRFGLKRAGFTGDWLDRAPSYKKEWMHVA
jgi:hypothetical protein